MYAYSRIRNVRHQDLRDLTRAIKLFDIIRGGTQMLFILKFHNGSYLTLKGWFNPQQVHKILLVIVRPIYCGVLLAYWRVLISAD